MSVPRISLSSCQVFPEPALGPRCSYSPCARSSSMSWSSRPGAQNKEKRKMFKASIGPKVPKQLHQTSSVSVGVCVERPSPGAAHCGLPESRWSAVRASVSLGACRSHLLGCRRAFAQALPRPPCISERPMVCPRFHSDFRSPSLFLSSQSVPQKACHMVGLLEDLTLGVAVVFVAMLLSVPCRAGAALISVASVLLLALRSFPLLLPASSGGRPG